MFIIIKETDIVEGVPSSEFYCPIARAIRRRTKSEDVRVDCTTYTVNGKQKPLSLSAYTFVARFDAGKSVKPGLMWV